MVVVNAVAVWGRGSQRAGHGPVGAVLLVDGRRRRRHGDLRVGVRVRGWERRLVLCGGNVVARCSVAVAVAVAIAGSRH